LRERNKLETHIEVYENQKLVDTRAVSKTVVLSSPKLIRVRLLQKTHGQNETCETRAEGTTSTAVSISPKRSRGAITYRTSELT